MNFTVKISLSVLAILFLTSSIAGQQNSEVNGIQATTLTSPDPGQEITIGEELRIDQSFYVPDNVNAEAAPVLYQEGRSLTAFNSKDIEGTARKEWSIDTEQVVGPLGLDENREATVELRFHIDYEEGDSENSAVLVPQNEGTVELIFIQEKEDSTSQEETEQSSEGGAFVIIGDTVNRVQGFLGMDSDSSQVEPPSRDNNDNGETEGDVRPGDSSSWVDDVIDVVTGGDSDSSTDSEDMSSGNYNGLERTCYSWDNESEEPRVFRDWQSGNAGSEEFAESLAEADGSSFNDVLSIDNNCRTKQVLEAPQGASSVPNTVKPSDTNSWYEEGNDGTWFFVEREHFMNRLGRDGERHPSSQNMTSDWEINGEDALSSGITKIHKMNSEEVRDEAVAFKLPEEEFSGEQYLKMDTVGTDEMVLEDRLNVDSISRGDWEFEPLDRNREPPRVVLESEKVSNQCIKPLDVDTEDVHAEGAVWASSDTGAAYWFKMENFDQEEETYYAGIEITEDGETSTVRRNSKIRHGGETVISNAGEVGQLRQGDNIEFQIIHGQNPTSNFPLPDANLEVSPSEECNAENGPLSENNILKDSGKVLGIEESSDTRVFNFSVDSQGSLSVVNSPGQVEYGDTVKFVFNVNDRGINTAEHAQIGKDLYNQYSWRKIQGEIKKDNGGATNWAQAYQFDTAEFFEEAWSIQYFQNNQDELLGSYIFDTTLDGPSGSVNVEHEFELVRNGEASSPSADSSIDTGDPDQGDYLPTQTVATGTIPTPDVKGINDAESSISYRIYCANRYFTNELTPPAQLSHEEISNCLSNQCDGPENKGKGVSAAGQNFQCESMVRNYCNTNSFTSYSSEENRCTRSN